MRPLRRVFRTFAGSVVVAGWILVIGAGSATLQASGSKKRDPTIAIRFHAEVYAFDPQFSAKVKVGNPPRELTIEKIPSISERDIVSFYPYKAADGSFSAVVQLDRHGSASLEGLSAQKLGLSIVVAVNGHAITALKVDKPISDGVLFIPFGLTEANIRSMGASFNIMGQDGSGRKPGPAPKPTPALDGDGTMPVPGSTNRF